MTEKTSRPVYHAPMSVDISPQGVRGAKPLATCTAGTNPKQNCNLGSSFNPMAECHAGSGNTQKCNQGSGVVSTCSAGTTAL
jgi:hypothetical protein